MYNKDDNTSSLDYYLILELTKDCTEDDIKKAYKREALRWHPDKHQAENKRQAELRFKLVSEAYEVLKDPEARKVYDLYGADAVRNGIPTPPRPQARSAAGGPGFPGTRRSFKKTKPTKQTEQKGKKKGFGSSQSNPFPFGSTFFAPRPAFHFHSPEEIFREFFGPASPFFDPIFAGMMPPMSPLPSMFSHRGFPGMMMPPMSFAGGSALPSSSYSTSYSSTSSSAPSSYLPQPPSRMGNGGVFTSRQVTTQYINGQKRVHIKTIDASGQVTEEVFTEGPNGQRQVQHSSSSSSASSNFLPSSSSSSSSSFSSSFSSSPSNSYYKHDQRRYH